jgi:ABC-2 type transport system permease protein
MRAFVGLVKRELWEHPVLYVGPIAANAFFALTTIVLVVRAIGSQENLRNIVSGLNMAGDTAIEVGRNLLLASPIAMVVGVTTVVGYFYFVECLYAERKERSILFFKSMPVTDTLTVLSKLFSGAVLLPVLSVLAFIVTQLLVTVFASAAIAFTDGEAGMLLNAGSLLRNWIFTFYVLLSAVLWCAPFIAFLMLASAWAKRAVFLWSLSPLLVMHVESLLPGTNVLGRAIIGHLGGYLAAAFSSDLEWSTARGNALQRAVETGPRHVLELADPIGFVLEPALWVGGAIAAAFVTGAIWLRRNRDDS